MTKKGKQMTSVRMSVDSHTIIKLIKKRYKSDDVTTQDDAFLKFIEENHSELYKEALRIAELKRELDDLLGDDEDE